MKNLKQIQHQIPPFAHSPLYNWHKFWARKTWNVVAEFISSYSAKGDLVFDPFVGSGVTAIEALKNRRRVIACDLNPIATEITRLTIKPVDLLQLKAAFERVKAKVKDKILDLYVTRCRKCKREITLACTVWNGGAPREVRYVCPYCEDRQEKGCNLDRHDKQRLARIEKDPINGWYPRNPLYYPNGRPFKEKQQYETIDGLFTTRNLQALAWIMEAIEDERGEELREFLKIGFTSMAHLCTKMLPISEAGHFTPFSSAWVEHSYWYANEFMEQNVWRKFESAILGHQGLLKAKAESNRYFKHVKFARNYQQVVDRKADVYIHTGDALQFMKEMAVDGALVDYIFTDPPYDASIQYGELTYIWVTWLKKDKGYLERVIQDEIIRNERQNKDFDVYHTMLSASFKGMYDILKQDNYLTVTFHNPTFKIRNATIRAGIFAGFDFQKIHHQELARPSAKSLLQPFGSATGDFYLRFYKAPAGRTLTRYQEIDEQRFEKIVSETTIRVLAERWEPTPYTVITNAIDPVLAKHGFFSTLNTGLDIKKVLERHLGKEFVLVKSKIGGAEGALWWFKDPSIIPHHDIPLSERVEQTVLRVLQSQYRATFTDVWKAVSVAFPNALTTDSTSIRETLLEYASPAQGGNWILKPLVKQRMSQHAEIIGILAQIGLASGLNAWIGRREQRDKFVAPLGGKEITLRELCKPPSIQVKNLRREELDRVKDIDLVLYTKSGEIEAILEVEHTTMLTEALERGSTIPFAVKRYLTIPEERENKLKSKLKSPMFIEQFKKDGWQILYYDTLRRNYRKLLSQEMEIAQLVGRPSRMPGRTKRSKTDSSVQGALQLEYH